MKSFVRLFMSQVVAFVAIFMMDSSNVQGFGDMQQNTGGPKEPAFASLEDGEDLFDAVVKDDYAEIHIAQVSFFGHATVGGIRQENNDSMIKLNLGTIKRLELLQAQYESKRFPDKDFSLFRKISVVPGTTKEVAEELLIPRNVVLCGIDKKTSDERAWYLSKIEQLIIVPVDGKAMLDMTLTTTTAPGQTVQHPKKDKAGEGVKAVDSEPNASLTENTKALVVVSQPTPHKETVVVETEKVGESKTVLQAVTDFIKAFIEIIKSIFNAIKNVFGF